MTVKWLHCYGRKQWWYIAILWSLSKVIPILSVDPTRGSTNLWVGVTEKLQNIKISNGDGETTPFFLKKKMMIYSNNMIGQKSTSNVTRKPNDGSHSSVGRIHIKIQNITINNGDGEMTPSCLEKINDYI